MNVLVGSSSSSVSSAVSCSLTSSSASFPEVCVRPLLCLDDVSTGVGSNLRLALSDCDWAALCGATMGDSCVGRLVRCVVSKGWGEYRVFFEVEVETSMSSGLNRLGAALGAEESGDGTMLAGPRGCDV